MKTHLTLSVSYINIHGLHNNLGCKIPNLSSFLINDINVLSETWTCNHKKDIPNFEHIELLPNKLTSKAKGRSSGGLIIYYKTYLQQHIKVIRKAKSHIWLEISKEIFYDAPNNLKICLAYIPPKESLYYSDELFQDLVDDIIDLTTENEDFLVMGDFNARTHTLTDHIPTAKHDDDTAGLNTASFLNRNNCDSSLPNLHGQNLINLCRSTNLRILNGRKIGDTTGNFTCFTHNGASTVDYALASQSLFDKIPLFHVSEQPEFSDHCKLTVEIPNKTENIVVASPLKWIPLKARFLWESDSSIYFNNALNSDQIRSKMHALNQKPSENPDIDSIGSDLSSIFLDAAELSLKQKRSKTLVSNKCPKKQHKKWFDYDCRQTKSNVNDLSRQKHKNPHNEYIRKAYQQKLREYKQLCNKKRNEFWNCQITKLQDNLQKESFWNTWEDFDECIRKETVAIKDGHTWESYFKKLLSSTTNDKPPPPPHGLSRPDTLLNSRIKQEEISNAINKLKNGKSAGADAINNEMIKHSTPELQQLICKIFNVFISNGRLPKNWCQGLITPIHKKGSKSDPNNYRGICVGNALLKLLCILLNNRLKTFVHNNNLINKSQIGFQEKCRTSDHILTLKTLINKHVTDKSKQKVHTAFIDFAKAFDTIWHNGLFHKLRMKGISGNFLHLIQDMYENTECAVKLNSSRTNYFKCSKGVRQGCPLSPTLFNLYLNDLIDNLNNSNTSPLTLGGEPVTCLMYADDIIILSCSHSGLQNCLNTLSEYCNQWKLSINTSKSKCMTFYKRNNKYKNEFFIRGIPLENVTEFTYLGITIDAACSFKETLRVLSSKAKRALFALNSRFKLKNLPIKAALKLFDSTIWRAP